MLRMLFEKTGNGVWISHLDLMRVFQRAFRRADIPIRHTEGFSPHAFVSLLLPLSVGTASRCELLEFAPEREEPLDTLPARLNRVLPEGIHCLEAYAGGKKATELTYLRAQAALEYDKSVPAGAEEQLRSLFARETLPVEKKAKKGLVVQDLRPMIRSLEVARLDGRTVQLDAVVCAQNPSLNPDLLAKAVAVHLPELAPDFARSTRLELFDAKMAVFR